MRFPHRCNNCRSRFTLKRRKENYINVRPCPTCGSKSYYFDKHEYKRRIKAKACWCDGLSFPHRPASTVWCKKHPTGPTQADYDERYGVT